MFDANSSAAQYLEMELLDFFRDVCLPDAERLGAVASIDDYELQIKHFGNFFRHHLAQQPGAALRKPRLGDVTNQLVRAAMDWQVARGRSRETANKIQRVICRLLRYAYDELHCLDQPPRVKQFAKLRRTRKTWNKEQFQKILDQPAKMPALQEPVGRGVQLSKAQFITTLAALIANVGGRITATMCAAPEALDHERRTLKLAAENQKQRADQVFHLTDDVYAALCALREPGQTARLIPWPYDENWDGRAKAWRAPTEVRALRKKCGKWRTLRALYKSVLLGAGLPAGRKDLFHAIRACVATWIADQLGEQAACEYMGHSGVAVTRVYLDYSQIRGERDAVSVLPQFQLKLFGEAG